VSPCQAALGAAIFFKHSAVVVVHATAYPLAPSAEKPPSSIGSSSQGGASRFNSVAVNRPKTSTGPAKEATFQQKGPAHRRPFAFGTDAGHSRAAQHDARRKPPYPAATTARFAITVTRCAR
jgi:hypothetical protein